MGKPRIVGEKQALCCEKKPSKHWFFWSLFACWISMTHSPHPPNDFMLTSPGTGSLLEHESRELERLTAFIKHDSTKWWIVVHLTASNLITFIFQPVQCIHLELQNFEIKCLTALKWICLHLILFTMNLIYLQPSIFPSISRPCPGALDRNLWRWCLPGMPSLQRLDLRKTFLLMVSPSHDGTCWWYGIPHHGDLRWSRESRILTLKSVHCILSVSLQAAK